MLGASSYAHRLHSPIARRIAARVCRQPCMQRSRRCAGGWSGGSARTRERERESLSVALRLFPSQCAKPRHHVDAVVGSPCMHTTTDEQLLQNRLNLPRRVFIKRPANFCRLGKQSEFAPSVLGNRPEIVLTGCWEPSRVMGYPDLWFTGHGSHHGSPHAQHSACMVGAAQHHPASILISTWIYQANQARDHINPITDSPCPTHSQRTTSPSL